MSTEKKHYRYPPLHFQWKPKSEIDLGAIQRMRDNFPKPSQLPPKAWYGEGVHYYAEIKPLTDSDELLKQYLSLTLSGLAGIGRLKIWVDWFHYLLPDLILRAAHQETSELYNNLLVYFAWVYSHELYEEYLGFRKDIFTTLLTTIMQKRFWPIEKTDFMAPYWFEPIEALRPETDGGALHTSMYLCLIYLPTQDIAEWVESIAVIESKKWQEIILRLLKSQDFEAGLTILAIPSENIALFRQEIAKYSQFNLDS
jgi:hypothetical protein